MIKKTLPDMRFSINVRSEEADELYPDQATYEDYEDIEVMVELMCDHPDVEGSLELTGPRWKIKEILKEISAPSVSAKDRNSTSAKSGSIPNIQEDPDETLTEVFQDISKKSTGKIMNPFQETLVHALDSFMRVK